MIDNFEIKPKITATLLGLVIDKKVSSMLTHYVKK